VIGARNNARVNLKINEPEGGTGGNRRSAPAAEEGQAETSTEAPSGEVIEEAVPMEKKSVDEALDDLDI
jgi:hypothetical protein